MFEWATENTGRTLVLIVALLLAIVAWVKILRSDSPTILKLLALPIPLIPIVGAIIALWIFSMPSAQPKDLRASMNHYGNGGRFIGNGSGRFTYSDFGDEAPDRPVKQRAFFWRRR